MQVKCHICKKKVGLIPFKCKCENAFCSLHRAPEDHACTFDFKKDTREFLEKHNQKCQALKLKNKL
jgi:predicted nucleic acid binding AN1-type Zn finger protein